MEERIKSIYKSYEKNEPMKLFFEKYFEKRNIIFENIYNILESNANEEENRKIQEIINQENIEDFDKIQLIKGIKTENFIKNFTRNYKPEQLQKYNLGLIVPPYTDIIKLVFYGTKEELKNYKIDENNKDEYSDEKNNKKSENLEEKNENKEKEKEKEETTENKKEELNHYIFLMYIDFIAKIKINEDEEWICNPDYAIYLIYIKKNLKNPHPDSKNEDESSYYLSDDSNIEHFVFITNNKYKEKKKILEIKADLNISNIYKDIVNKNDSYEEYINNYLQGINSKEINIKKYINNQIVSYFEKLNKYEGVKNIIFQEENILNGFYKIISLNDLYYNEFLRFFYLDLKIFNEIKNTNEKRKYLSYYIARLYNCNTEFEKDFENFVNENLKNVKDKNFINILIDKIIDENRNLIKNNEETPFYIIIDNIDTYENYKILERLMNHDYDVLKNTYIYGVINIDEVFGQEKFMKVYNKKITERGFYVHYLNSNNSDIINNNDHNLNKFFKDIGNSIKILKDFLLLIYFKKYVNEYTDFDYNILMNYIKYIKLIIKEDNNNFLYINDIEFKNEEIKNLFIKNYKDILMHYLNNKNDNFIRDLFSDVNSIFFEKQIILDILLDKIKSNKERNFKELKVHLIYNMDLDLSKIDFSQYKDKDIIIIQDSKTGEIYDFGIIVNNCVKLYQVSTIKTKEDLIRLDKKLIEFDCDYMKNKYLNKFGDYNNFSFGIITSTSTFNNYSKLLEEKKNISNAPYNLMKEYCLKNNYELFIYDLFKQKIYKEDETNKLIECDLYNFNVKNELNIPKLKKIYAQNPKKISMKTFKKENFIKKLKDTELFDGLDDNMNSINVIGKFEYKDALLNIEEIEEDNYFIYISGNTKDKKNLEIFKYGKETDIYEVEEKKRIFYEFNKIKEDKEDKKVNENKKNIEKKENKITLSKNGSEILLFNIGKEIKFLGKKRKIDLTGM